MTVFDHEDTVTLRVRHLPLLLMPLLAACGHAAASSPTVDEKEGLTDESREQDTAQQPVKFGGALRFNYFLKDFDEQVRTRRGDLGFDIFRINADGEWNRLFLSVDYRFYTYMNVIHHGYVGYAFDDTKQIQAGITQVPFGLLPYAAHSYWFGVPYFIGLGDDYDSGIKFIDRKGPWDLQLAFFKNAELGDASNLKRYSWDPVTTGAAANEETNTVNARATYTFNKGAECEHELGLSGQGGQLHNIDTDDTGRHWAAAVHLDSHCGRWNLQLEAASYRFEPENPPGITDDTMTLGAFAGSQEVAAAGNVYVANLAYNLSVPWPQVQLLTCYNDFSVLDKSPRGYKNSMLNTTGCLLQIGPTYTYIDVIRGKNMIYFGNGSLAGGGSTGWDTRFNINFGIYW